MISDLSNMFPCAVKVMFNDQTRPASQEDFLGYGLLKFKTFFLSPNQVTCKALFLVPRGVTSPAPFLVLISSCARPLS